MSEGSGNKMYPLRIFEESDEPSRRPRGRGRGGRGYRGKSHSRSRHVQEDESDNNSEGTAQSNRGRSRGRNGPRQGDRRGQSHGVRNSHPNANSDNQVTTRDKPRLPPTFARQKLINFSERVDIDEVLLDISHSRSGFSELLQKKPDPSTVCHLVQLLRNVSESRKVNVRREIMECVERTFLHNLTDLLNEISMKDDSTEIIWRSVANLSKFLKNILQLLTVIITTFSSSLAKCKNVIRTIREIQEEFQIDDLNLDIANANEVLQREKETRQSSIIAFNSMSGPQKVFARRFASEPQPSEPPDSFRDISIFPSLTDFTSESRPFLRANRVEGKYDSLETYLDVQFRLLREDYIQPLRKGISEYKSCIRENIPVKRLRDIRLYHSVHILRPICSGNGINYILQFDIKFFKNMNWAASRRLLYGSLICLSKDNFETMFYAVVTERSEKDLKDGNIQVHFEDLKADLDIGPNDEFLMVETTAYFEAYRYILEGLHEVKEAIPFQKYIIDCEKTVKPPKYLLGKVPRYDFSCLLDDDDACFPLVPVLNTQRWPTNEDLGLDHTQYEAIKRAITKELAIIQGPPGTGKTFVGLKIAKLLLKNDPVWNEGQGSPILVVCYTNHALDQFLEAILGFCDDKILRIGGRCKSEHLVPFILRNVKKQRRENKERPFRLMQKERDCMGSVKRCERQIAEVSAKIKKTTLRILSYSDIEHFMTDNQKYGFKLILRDTQSVSVWLGLNEDTEESDSQKTMPVREIWEQEIIENIKPMPDHESNFIYDPWDLTINDLMKRAELYKSWVCELLKNVQDEIIFSNHSPQSKHKLQQLENRAGVKILDIETLLDYTTKMSSKFQIQRLLIGKTVSAHYAIPEWLGLSGSKHSINVIKYILDTMMDTQGDKSNHEEEDEDLEEDRELEEENFLFDYAPKAHKPDKRMKSDVEWITEWKERKQSHRVKNILNTTKQISSVDAERMDIMNLNETKRNELYAYWVRRYRSELRENVKAVETEYNELTMKLLEVREMETVEIMKQAKVIGMTTTGAAKYRKLFQSVCPRIIIVEEAAEVLESHIVTSLNSNCQHLILIGDHKQLRPSTAVYDLSKKYQMDVSLFERMVRNDVPYVTLEEQHRMRPEISNLLKHKDLYPQLRDHSSVTKYDHINGIDSDVQFINHEESELTSAESTSYSNPHEAKYISSLCQYIMNQGYKPDEITVITPYMGQVFLLRREMPKTMFQGVRITAIDNYQGEENNIILLSLVRSSVVESGKRNRIGFVGIENRICVALSRAKKGLYVIGNFKLLAQCSTMWADMIRSMEENGRVQKSLTLRCQNHPDQFVRAAICKDFQKVPNGGCQKSCKQRLSKCGHLCPKSCHIVDKEHLKATCTMPCEKIVCESGHGCTLKCWQECGKCKTMVDKTLPICQHKAKMPCFKDVYLWKCQIKCDFILPCGHSCQRPCFECRDNGHEGACKQRVVKKLKCNHSVTLMCHEKTDNIECKEPCTDILDCNHPCTGKCGICSGGRIHFGCKSACKKVLPCGHQCSFPCSEICPPCTRICLFPCSHGVQCKKKCWESCDTCNQPCAFRCKHQKCDHDCNELCPNAPCNKMCQSVVKSCGHKCRSLCGEVCLCIICDSKYIHNDMRLDFDDSTCFIQISDCKCIIEVGQMDQLMRYESNGRNTAVCKYCPRCQKPIRKHIKRYTNKLKLTRAKIVEKFTSIMGTAREKKTRMHSLMLQIDGLGKGVNKATMDKLTMAVTGDNSFDSLHTAERKIDCMKSLIKVTDKFGIGELLKFVSDMKDIVIQPKILSEYIVQDRKFSTKQYWNEISREILRLKLGLELSKSNQTFVLLNPARELRVEHMFKKAFEVLKKRDFNEKRQKALKTTLETLRVVPSPSNIDSRIVSKLTIILDNAYEDEIEYVEEVSRNDATNRRANMNSTFSDVKMGGGTEIKSKHEEYAVVDKKTVNDQTRKVKKMEHLRNIHGQEIADSKVFDKTIIVRDRKSASLYLEEINGSDELLDDTYGSDALMDSIQLASDSCDSIIATNVPSGKPAIPPRTSITANAIKSFRPPIPPRKSIYQNAKLMKGTRISSRGIEPPIGASSLIGDYVDDDDDGDYNGDSLNLARKMRDLDISKLALD